MKSFLRSIPAPRYWCAITAMSALTSGAFAADDVVARVSGSDVRIDEVRPYLQNLSARDQAVLENNPAELTKAVRALLTTRVVLAEANAQKWEKSPTFLAQLDKVKDQLLVESFLASVSEPPADFPSETEVKAAYETNKAALVAPREFHVAQIFIAAPSAADSATIKTAQAKFEAVTKQLGQSGADFAAIARAQSDDKQSAANGGELGWLTDAQLRPEIKDTVTALAAGGVSKPVRLADGWHFMKVLEVRDSRQLTFEEVHGELNKRLRSERAKANRQAYLAKLLEKNPISVNELAISQILPSAPPSK